MDLFLVGTVLIVWFVCVNVVLACAVVAGRADRRDERRRQQADAATSYLAKLRAERRVRATQRTPDHRLRPTIR